MAVFFAMMVMPRSRSIAAVHHAFSDLLVLPEDVALPQHPVDQGGLPVVDVRDDRDISDVLARRHYRPSRCTLKTSRTLSRRASTRESCSMLVTCRVAFTVALLSGFAAAESATSCTWFSLMTAATSRRKPSRSQPWMRIATG